MAVFVVTGALQLLLLAPEALQIDCTRARRGRCSQRATATPAPAHQTGIHGGASALPVRSIWHGAIDIRRLP